MDKPILRLAEGDDFSENTLNLLRKNFNVDLTPVTSVDLVSILDTCDIFWFRLGFQLNDKVLRQNQKCKILVTPVTGIDHIDEKLCLEYNIRIVCLRGESQFLKTVRATAEHTLLLTMALMRQLVSAVSDVLEYNWDRDKFRSHELYGKKVGIVGYGRLGTIVADYFHTLGCQVGYFDIIKMEHPTYVVEYKGLHDLIEDADIVSIHIPYNKENHYLFSEDEFERFTENKYLINTSRGGIINETALLRVLTQSKIGGAALDVLEGEPEVAKNPLLEYARQNNNLLITPHLGGNTFESFAKTEWFIANKLIDLVQN